MKVVHLSTSVDSGGAAVAMLNLHRGLLQLGHDSTILAFQARTPLPPRSRLLSNRWAALQDLVDREVIYRHRTLVSNTHFSLNLAGHDFCAEPEIREADIVHLHWVASLVSASSLSSLADLGKPAVWTLHDFRPFTAGCHYPAGCDGYRGDCDCCPQLTDEVRHFPRQLFQAQKEAIARLRPCFVSPSQWLAAAFASSAIGRSMDIRVIPNAADTGLFRSADRAQARRRLGMDAEATYVLLAAWSFEEKRKGGELCAAVLRTLATLPGAAPALHDKLWRIVSCGAPEHRVDTRPWPIEHLGHLSKDDMAALYSACDVLLFCSEEDNYPNIVLEALTCGLPVVAFAAGGVGELVTHGQDGLLAAPRDTPHLAEHLLRCLSDHSLRRALSRGPSDAVRVRHSLEGQAAAYAAVYAELARPNPDVPNSVPSATSPTDAQLAIIQLGVSDLVARARDHEEALRDREMVIAELQHGQPVVSATPRRWTFLSSPAVVGRSVRKRCARWISAIRRGDSETRAGPIHPP